MPGIGTTRGHLAAAFRRYGLPARMLTDDGAPWGSGGYAATSPWTRLTVWLARLGVASSHGRPNHPQIQGKGKRFHRTLKAGLLRWRPFADLADAQAQLDPWRHTYDHERPHEAIGLAVPAGRYRPSPRPFPEALPAVEYGPDDATRKVDGVGRLHFRGRAAMVGSALFGERVDLQAADAAGSRLARCRPLEPLADAADVE